MMRSVVVAMVLMLGVALPASAQTAGGAAAGASGTAAGMSRAARFSKGLGRLALPISVAMATWDIIHGESANQVIRDFVSYYGAGAAVSALDAVVYPVLFGGGPPGWVAAGAYTIAKVALATYLGDRLSSWLGTLTEPNTEALAATQPGRRGVRGRIEDIEKVQEETVAANNPGTLNVATPGDATTQPGSAGDGAPGSAGGAPGSAGGSPGSMSGHPGSKGGRPTPPVVQPEPFTQGSNGAGTNTPSTGASSSPSVPSHSLPTYGMPRDPFSGGAGSGNAGSRGAGGTTSSSPRSYNNEDPLAGMRETSILLAQASELVRSLEELARLGTTHVAVNEPTSRQGALDEFYETRDRDQLAEYLGRPKDDPVLDVVDEARRNKLKLVAGGPTPDGRSNGILETLKNDPGAKLVAVTEGAKGGKDSNPKAVESAQKDPRTGSDLERSAGPLGQGSATPGARREGGTLAGRSARDPAASKTGKEATDTASKKEAKDSGQASARSTPTGSTPTKGSETSHAPRAGSPVRMEKAEPIDPNADLSGLVLQWKLQEGDVLEYEHQVDQKFNVMSGSNASMQQRTLIATERLETLGVEPDGNYRVRWQITRLRAQADGRDVYDSAAPEKGGAIGTLIKRALGDAREFVMTPSGRLDGKRGTNFLADDASLGELLRTPLVLPLPESELSERHGWSVDVPEASGSLVHNRAYTLEGRLSEGQSVRGDITMRLENAPPSVKLHEGTGHQRAVFDYLSGMLRESETNFSVTLENEIDGQPVKIFNTVKATTKLKNRGRQ